MGMPTGITEKDEAMALVNRIGNCVLLEKNFNISKSKEPIESFLNKVHEFKSGQFAVKDWSDALAVPAELLNPTGYTVDAIRTAIDMRDKAVRDELAEFARGKKTRTDLTEQKLPVSSAAKMGFVVGELSPKLAEFSGRTKETMKGDNAVLKMDMDAASVYRERNEEILNCFRELMPERQMPDNAPARHYMQIRTGFGSTHYEFLHRGRADQRRLQVAIHFESTSKQQNHELCAFLKSHASMIQHSVGEEVTFVASERAAGWASVYVERFAEPWTDEIAKWAAHKMCSLIKAVQPLLEEHFTQPV
jgi:hypothetical protein